MLKPEDVTIGISPRERYKVSAQMIRRLREKTPKGPQVLYVDAAVPEKYRPDIADALQEYGDYNVLQSDAYLLPIQATNRLIQECRTPILALLENDVMVDDDWIDPVLEEFNDPHTDYISPEIMEAHKNTLEGDAKIVYHFNPVESDITVADDGTIMSDVKRIPGKNPPIDVKQKRQIKHLERHAFFGKTGSLPAIHPLPEFLNTREQMHIALCIHMARQRIMMVPQCSVKYLELPLELEEIDNYLLRWDPERGQQSNDFVERTWKLGDFRSSMDDINNRIRRALALRQKLQES